MSEPAGQALRPLPDDWWPDEIAIKPAAGGALVRAAHGSLEPVGFTIAAHLTETQIGGSLHALRPSLWRAAEVARVADEAKAEAATTNAPAGARP